jgi:hypothetical protein
MRFSAQPLCQVTVMTSLNRILQTSALGFAAVGLGACTTLPVTTDVNPNASVGSCHTYTFAQEHVANGGQQPGAFANPLNSDRLRAAIAANLGARGIEPVAARQPADCVVGYAIGSRIVADDYGWGVGYGWGGWGPRGFGYGAWGGYGPGWSPVYNEGRITVDLFDAKTHTAIWHASVNQSVGDLTGPAAELKINQATSAIFTKFPGLAVPPAGGHSTT